MKQIILRCFILGFIIITVFIACKKDKQLSAQYYGEPIGLTKEFFPDQELFEFNSTPKMSPNGRYIVYRVASTISYEKQGLWMIDLLTWEKYLLQKFASQPSWSPDNEKLCFTSGGNLFISDLTGKSLQQLTQNRRSLRPDWHPTKNKIVFDSAISGIYTIEAIDIVTKLIIQSVNAENVGINAGWIGKTDSVLTKIGNVYNIVSMRTGDVLNNINAKGLASSDIVTEPAISLDGQKIAFQANNGIYVLNTDGTNVQQILYNRINRKPGTPFKSGDKLINDLSWHPDGKHIIYQQIEFTKSTIGFGNIYGEGYSTLFVLDIEKALKINKP
ncbi:MAG: hypothetical protein ABI390_02425 [Daejeonella sp.]